MNHVVRLLALLACAAPCAAQTHMRMPEGSKDVHVALVLANAPAALGSAQRSMYVSPLISAQFANGVFIDMNTVGVHLSGQPQLEYGVQFAPTVSRVQVRTGEGWEAKRKLTPEVGGFVRHTVAHGVQVRSTLMYGGSTDHRGLRLRLGAILGMPVAEHHHVGLEFDSTFANRSAQQADFAVAPEQAGPEWPVYAVSGGLRDTRVTAFWNWELSTKYTFKAMLWRTRLHGSAAASPRIEQASGIAAAMGVSYQF